ncbi:MAG: nucleotidyltransferase family protein [Candidatus Omnitrophota bacterium]
MILILLIQTNKKVNNEWELKTRDFLKKMKNIKKIFISPRSSLRRAIEIIQKGGAGIALIVDTQERLIGTVTDGDIRRAILHKIKLNEKIGRILKDKPFNYPNSVAVSVDTHREDILRLMKEKLLRHIPLLDKHNKVVDLVLLSEFVEEEIPLPLSAVVMAGGRGQRLHPLTNDIPKPMLPLDNRPIMECIVEQLRKSGITKVNISTNYKSEIIVNHFGNGDKFGVEIDYINEDQPLGTAGALGLMAPPDKPVLVINGDILTQLNFCAMFDFHRSYKAMMTVGVKKYEMSIPYGVIETEDVMITGLVEKPLQEFIVNAGIYLIEPSVCQYIPKGSYFNMTDLVNALIKAKHRVISFPIQEYWLDVGHHASYNQAKIDVQNGKV